MSDTVDAAEKALGYEHVRIYGTDRLIRDLFAELKAARAEAERLRVEFDNYTTWAEHELDAAHGGER